MSVIDVQNVSKHFGSVAAVLDLSFSVEQGRCFGLLGPNGAGKSTLMRMLYGRSRQDADGRGAIRVLDYDPNRSELNIKALSGVVPQENNLDEELNVLQNLQMYGRFYGLSERQAKERSRELLAYMSLEAKADQKIKFLSGGMKRRLVIARALLNRPRLLILDEPTTGLDPQVRHVIWDRIRKLQQTGTTVLLSTHYMEEAFQLCDDLLIMDQGRMILCGSPSELIRTHIEPYVLELIGDPALPDLDAFEGTVRMDSHGSVIRLYAERLEDLKALADRLDHDPYYLRQSNLEDVFLKTTGRELGDA